MQQYLDRAAWWIEQVYLATPWARAGLLVVAIVAVLLAVPVGKLLRSNPIIVGLLIAAFGAVLVFTLTPRLRTYGEAGTCYLQFGRPTRADLVAPTDVSLNLLLMFPIGVLLTWLRPFFAVCGAFLLALVMPVAIEYTQYAMESLGRFCSFYDIQTNLIGLIAGVAVGLVIRLVWTTAAAFGRMVRR